MYEEKGKKLNFLLYFSFLILVVKGNIGWSKQGGDRHRIISEERVNSYPLSDTNPEPEFRDIVIRAEDTVTVVPETVLVCNLGSKPGEMGYEMYEMGDDPRHSVQMMGLPMEIVIDEQGDIWIHDAANDRIQIFRNGKLLRWYRVARSWVSGREREKRLLRGFLKMWEEKTMKYTSVLLGGGSKKKGLLLVKFRKPEEKEAKCVVYRLPGELRNL